MSGIAFIFFQTSYENEKFIPKLLFPQVMEKKMKKIDKKIPAF